MKVSRPLGAGASFGLGLVTARVIPAAFLLKAFLAGLGIVMVLGLLVTIDAKDENPLDPASKALSWVFLNTSRPNAVVPNGMTLFLFLLAGGFTMGIGTGILWVSTA